jgi:hypothetical protein
MKKRSLGNLTVDGRIISKLILKNQSVRVWIGLICLRMRSRGKPFKYGNDSESNNKR